MRQNKSLELHLLYPAPLRDEQRGGFGRFSQRIQVDIFVEAVDRRAAGAEAQARDIVVQAIEPRIGQSREDEVLDLAAIDSAKSLAESRFRRGGVLQLLAF